MTNLFQDSQRSLEETSENLSVTNKHLESTREDFAKTVDDLHTTRLERDENGFIISEHVKSEDTLLGEASQVTLFGQSTPV